MRIVVTGVTGQVGKALTATLGKLGTVVPADRSVLNLAEPTTLSGHSIASRPISSSTQPPTPRLIGPRMSASSPSWSTARRRA